MTAPALFLTTGQPLMNVAAVATAPTPVVHSSEPKSTRPTERKREAKVCQICGKKGHIASDCYNRLNLTNYYPARHNRQLTPIGATPSVHYAAADHLTMW